MDNFEEQGYLHLGQLVDPNPLCERINEIMMGHIKYDSLMYQLEYPEGYELKGEQETPGHKGATYDYRKIVGLESDPLFREIIQHPICHDIMIGLIGDNVSIFRAMFLNKPSKKSTILPWHQEIGPAQRWRINTHTIYSVWTALDDSTIENGCLQVIPGSHKWGALHDDHFATEEDKEKYDFDGNKVYLEMKAGQSVLLHNLLFHQSETNCTDKARRAFSVAYIPASTRNIETGESYPVVFQRWVKCTNSAYLSW